MIICSHCGWENEDESVFCANCGRPIGRNTRMRAAQGAQESPSARRSAFRALRAAHEREEGEPEEGEAGLPDLEPPAQTQAPEAPTLLDFRIPARLMPKPAGGEAGEAPAEDAEPADDDALPDLEPPAATPGQRPSVDLGEVAQSIRAEARASQPEALPSDEGLAEEAATADAEIEDSIDPGGTAPYKAVEMAPMPGARVALPIESDELEDEEPDDGIEANPPAPPGPRTDPNREPPEGALLGPPVETPEPEEGRGSIAEEFESVDLAEASESSGAGEVGPEPDVLDEEGIEAAEDLDAPANTRRDTAEVEEAAPPDEPELIESGEYEALASDVFRAVTDEDDEDDPSRAMPPPLPAIRCQFLLRPLSTNLSDAHLVPVPTEGVVVGRTSMQDLDDPFLSPAHGRFEADDGRLRVTDLRSFNGVWVRVKGEVTVPLGGTFMVGHQMLRVETIERAGADYAADGTRAFGPTVASGGLRLVQLSAGGIERDVYHVPPGGVRIGRHIADIVFTADNFMSGTHALVVPADGGALLRDLGSRNGTWLRVDGSRELLVGDAVMLGQTVWRVGRPVD